MILNILGCKNEKKAHFPSYNFIKEWLKSSVEIDLSMEEGQLTIGLIRRASPILGELVIRYYSFINNQKVKHQIVTIQPDEFIYNGIIAMMAREMKLEYEIHDEVDF